MLRARGGVLTDELARAPGGFGLGQVPVRLKPDAVTTLVCGFCSTGCALDVHLRDGAPVNLTPAVPYPVNRGTACPKGWESLTPLSAPDRAVTPLLRDGRGRLRPVAWADALTAFVDGFRGVQARHGPESVAFLSTGQIVTEEMALLGALAKFGMGMIHGDGNTRQCMATSVVAYKQAFGFDAPPYTYADFEESEVVVLWGSNLAVAHPIMWERVQANRHSPEVIVVDPRYTETAMAATQHYPLTPKSDLTLLYALAGLLIDRGAVDERFLAAHTSGFDDFAAFCGSFSLERAAEATGLDAAAIERLAATIAGGERVSFWWTMGVNQSHEAVLTAQALINLALMTGNVGRPGTGANSITGQCNAMGSRLFSNTTSLFGGRDFESAADRAEVADILGIDPGRIPSQQSWAYDQIVDGIATGAIRGLWVVATNGAHSWINQTDFHELLDRLEFLVVQDMYVTTETATRAHLVLPAAGWGEKEGTFINSERRIGRVARVAQAPGEALDDFSIFKAVAEAWGAGDLFADWETPEAVFSVLVRLSAGRPCDFSGITGYEELGERGGVQWPAPPGWDRDSAGTERRLFEDGRFFHPDGRARFLFGEPRPPRERPSERYPFVLLTGRGSAAEWHTRTRTAKSPLLARLSASTPYVEVAPADARGLGITPGEEVVVESRRGSMRVRAHITTSVASGQVFIPMHFSDTNRLTFPAFDPSSRQPSYKYSAVALRRLHAWEGQELVASR